MMKINDNDLMDYVDGTLDVARLAAVEAHLRMNAEAAELVSSMKFAQGALQDWDESEPVTVSPDFWVKVREQLPAQPERSWSKGVLAQMRAWLVPAQSPFGLSVRVAAVAAVIAMMAVALAPHQDTHQIQADPGFTSTQRLTPDEQSFIQQSLDRHSAYVSSQPLSGPALVAPGDVSSAEHGDDTAGHDQTPE